MKPVIITASVLDSYLLKPFLSSLAILLILFPAHSFCDEPYQKMAIPKYEKIRFVESDTVHIEAYCLEEPYRRPDSKTKFKKYYGTIKVWLQNHPGKEISLENAINDNFITIEGNDSHTSLNVTRNKNLLGKLGAVTSLIISERQIEPDKWKDFISKMEELKAGKYNQDKIQDIIWWMGCKSSMEQIKAVSIDPPVAIAPFFLGYPSDKEFLAQQATLMIGVVASLVLIAAIVKFYGFAITFGLVLRCLFYAFFAYYLLSLLALSFEMSAAIVLTELLLTVAISLFAIYVIPLFFGAIVAVSILEIALLLSVCIPLAAIPVILAVHILSFSFLSFWYIAAAFLFALPNVILFFDVYNGDRKWRNTIEYADSIILTSILFFVVLHFIPFSFTLLFVYALLACLAWANFGCWTGRIEGWFCAATLIIDLAVIIIAPFMAIVHCCHFSLILLVCYVLCTALCLANFLCIWNCESFRDSPFAIILLMDILAIQIAIFFLLVYLFSFSFTLLFIYLIPVVILWILLIEEWDLFNLF